MIELSEVITIVFWVVLMISAFNGFIHAEVNKTFNKKLSIKVVHLVFFGYFIGYGLFLLFNLEISKVFRKDSE